MSYTGDHQVSWKVTPAETLPAWTKKEVKEDCGTPKFYRQEIG